MPTFNPQSLSQLDKERLSAYKSNLDFYEGKQWESASRNRQLVFNYAKISIDKITSFMMQGLNFACEPAGDSTKEQEQAQQAEDLLYEVYTDNNLAQLDYETEVDAAILGDGCYKVTWDAAEKRVRITSPDVHGIYAWWTGDDLSKVWRLASRYQLSADEIEMLYQRTITTNALASQVAEAVLDKARLQQRIASILVPPHCGIELWDVVSVLDPLAAQSSQLYRVIGIRLLFNADNAAYHQQLTLGAV